MIGDPMPPGVVIDIWSVKQAPAAKSEKNKYIL